MGGDFRKTRQTSLRQKDQKKIDHSPSYGSDRFKTNHLKGESEIPKGGHEIFREMEVLLGNNPSVGLPTKLEALRRRDKLFENQATQ